jgi:capsular exopolysaccharide synthesis family protein
MSSREGARTSGGGDALANALNVISRRWLLIAGVLLVCVGLGVFKHSRAGKEYEATASVSFQSGTLAGQALQVGGSSSEPQREADTEVLVAHSPEVAQGVSHQLQVPAQASELLDDVKVEAAQNANILNISATTSSPRYSALLANAFAQQYIAFRTRSQLSGIDSAQGKLEKQLVALPAGSPERAALQESVQRLNSLRAVAGGGANVIGLAVAPTGPTGTGLSTTIVISLLVGLAVAFSLVFLLESLDRRIKSIEDVEREYRLSALTGVPQSAHRFRRAVEREDELEPYRILRSALDFAAVDHQLDTLLVTSAIAGEGKTTVAVDLAHAIALTGRHTVLVELDLRRPTFAKHFDLDPSRGITTVLIGAASLEEVLVEPFPSLPNLSVLPSGRLPQNPSELLGSPRIAEIISELSSEDGIVIVDAPPLNPVADTQALLDSPAIHATLMVGRINLTTRDEVQRARAILDLHMVNPIGIAVTGLRDTNYYGYNSYAAEEPTLDVEAGGRPPVSTGTRTRPRAKAKASGPRL